ncbi:MAG: hypothetical protein EBV69_12435, partial [Oxalobacteraceae bacterium]|nr:hypothetical protein [Oxalobacteraceae bacterium]
RSKILLQFNISTYETTVRLESLSGLTASYVLSGFFDKYDIVKSGLELEVRLTDSRVISRYTGDVLTSSAGKVGPWLVHDMTKAVTLTPYQDLVSFDASQGKTASLLSGFKSGSDLLQLAASTAPAGAAISANLENRNFLSGAGIKLPASPEQYVIYDTSTGVVYFDQDGNGPSPTWPALILEKGTALVASDIQISKPQVYTLAGDRGVINEGETLSVLVGSSNVAVGTEVSYSITGISPFDVSGVKLTGSVKLDANGEALIKIPLAADSISEGPETIVLTLAGQILSVPINDTSRAAADTQSATYIVRANTASVDEGGVAGFSLTTTNVAAGTAVSYILSGVSAADVVGGQLAGVVVVDAQGKATITVPLANDNLTEGVETLVVTVQGFGATMQINDNSKALLTLPASYAITTPGAGVFEVRAAVGSEVNTASSLVVKVGNTWTTGFRA